MAKEFSFNSMEEFDKHINSSIPAFSTLQEIILNLSPYFIKDSSTVLDLGCSTGALLKKLHYINPIPCYIGYDKSASILEQLDISSDDIELNCEDIAGPAFYPPVFDFAILSFTLQFLNLSDRLPLLSKLRANLKAGGAIVVAEKIYQPSGYLEEVFSMTHYDFKRKSFSAEEILDKQRTLRKIMKPLSEQENRHLFIQAGFKNHFPIWQSLNFKSWILLAD